MTLRSTDEQENAVADRAARSHRERGGETPLQECPGGPLLVRGAETWTDEDGVEHPITRAGVAVRRCDKSQRPPRFDGTQHVIPTPTQTRQAHPCTPQPRPIPNVPSPT